MRGNYILIFFLCLFFSFSSFAQFSLPLNSLRLTSGFGPRIHPITGEKKFHSGIDLSACFEKVYSVLSGVIMATGEDAIIGKYVKIDHGKLQSIYGHLSIVLIGKGDKVINGQLIAVSGNSGRSTGAHLHLSIKSSGAFLNPLVVIKALLAITIKNHMGKDLIFENDKRSLAAMLSLLAEKGRISLSQEQASAYGVDQADQLPQEEEGGQDGF